MDERQIFIRTIDSLREASVSNDPYQILKASADVRLLLLDGFAAKMNRTHRLSIKFLAHRVLETECHALMLEMGGFMHAGLRAVDPETKSPTVGSQEPSILNLDQFLALPVMMVESQNITVKDVIQYAAEAAGGVHVGKPRDERHGEKALHDARGMFVVSGVELHLTTLQPLLAIIVRGLSPLYQAVKTS